MRNIFANLYSRRVKYISDIYCVIFSRLHLIKWDFLSTPHVLLKMKRRPDDEEGNCFSFWTQHLLQPHSQRHRDTHLHTHTHTLRLNIHTFTVTQTELPTHSKCECLCVCHCSWLYLCVCLSVSSCLCLCLSGCLLCIWGSLFVCDWFWLTAPWIRRMPRIRKCPAKLVLELQSNAVERSCLTEVCDLRAKRR